MFTIYNLPRLPMFTIYNVLRFTNVYNYQFTMEMLLTPQEMVSRDRTRRSDLHGQLQGALSDLQPVVVM